LLSKFEKLLHGRFFRSLLWARKCDEAGNENTRFLSNANNKLALCLLLLMLFLCSKKGGNKRF
jgi:hypothetical protein